MREGCEVYEVYAVSPHGKEVTGYVDPSARTLDVYTE